MAAPYHDTGYKLWFSHPELVRDLLKDFMPGEWVKEANFPTLERVNASYVSESERQRHDDMVWRLKVGPNWVWVYLLLEFQSEPDPWMALRMWVYVGLLAQHLVREGEIQDGRLPALVPIVLYRGDTAWKAATNVADCFAPSLPGLEPYRPQLLYHLIDQARLQLHPEQEVRNLADALFRLERSRTLQDIAGLIKSVDAMLQGDGAGPIRRTINVWLRMLLRRKAPKANVEDLDAIEDLLKGTPMLEKTIERWFDEATQKGVLIGEQRGERRGEALLLQKMLIKRFGALSAAIAAKIADAAPSQIEAWSDLIFDAPSLDAIFGPDVLKH